MDVNKKIQELIEKNNIFLFMKGTPDVPQCGFSLAVANILKLLNVKFESFNVLENEDIRQGIKMYSDWPTIPQLYIKGKFIGGSDIVKEMFEKGELKILLKKDLYKSNNNHIKNNVTQKWLIFTKVSGARNKLINQFNKSIKKNRKKPEKEPKKGHLPLPAPGCNPLQMALS